MRFGDDFFIALPTLLWVLDGWLHPTLFIFSGVIILSLPPSLISRPLSVLIESGRYSFLLIGRSSSGDFSPRDIKSYLFMYILIFKPLLLLLHPMTHLLNALS